MCNCLTGLSYVLCSHCGVKVDVLSVPNEGNTTGQDQPDRSTRKRKKRS